MRFLSKFFKMQPRRELREFYTFSILFSFASALITVFEPVFFYTQGISLSLISLYYGLHYTLYLFLLPLGGKFAARFGWERSLSMAMPVFVVYFLVLAWLPSHTWFFWWAWILLTVFKIFYWPAAHAELTKFSEGKNRGTEIAWMFAIARGVGVIGPMIGGVVAAVFGFPALFILAAVMSLVAAVPLLKTKERFRVQKLAYVSFWKIIFAKRHRRMVVTMLGWAEDLVAMVYWPLFIFIVMGSVDKLGYVVSFNVLLMTLFGFFIGEVSDRYPRRVVLRINWPFVVLSYLFRCVAISPVRVVLTDALSRISTVGVRIPMWCGLYREGKRTGSLKYAVAFEMVLCIGKAAAAFFLVWVFAVSAPYAGFVIAFMLAAAASGLYLFL
jgi:MFS family permease